MRILVANNHLHTTGGSESFTWALAVAYNRQGYDVDVFDAKGTPYALAERAHDLEKYDAAFISHNTTARWLFAAFPAMDPRRVIQTVHGAHALETPYTSRLIRHVVVSRELQERYPEYPVVMNAVDLERFKPNASKRGVLSLCQSVEMNAVLETVCAAIGVEFSYRDKFTNPTGEIAEEMNAAQIVIGLGRSAIEAMASGCAVIVADARPYQGAWSDGLLTAQNYNVLARCNFSGRVYRDGVNAPALRALIELALARPYIGAEMRTLAEQHHDVRRAAEKYLEMVG